MLSLRQSVLRNIRPSCCINRPISTRSTPQRNTVEDKFPSLSSIDATQLPQQKQPKGWYFVPRSRGNRLPVYSEVKTSDGTVHTVITHVQGNVDQLRNDLLKFLNVDKSRIVVKPTSNKILIKHNVMNEVKALLGQYF